MQNNKSLLVNGVKKKVFNSSRTRGKGNAEIYITCCADGIQKTVVVVCTNQSAREHNSVERDIILCHELMKSDLKEFHFHH